MKHCESLPSVASRPKIGHLQFAPAIQTRRRDTAQPISALRPLIVMFLAGLGSAVIFSTAFRHALSYGSMPWAMLVLGAVHAIVALAGFVVWKRVRRDDQHLAQWRPMGAHE